MKTTKQVTIIHSNSQILGNGDPWSWQESSKDI